MKRRSRQLEAGFTLIEALMAAVVLAVAVSAAILPFTTGMRCQDVEVRQNLAVSLGEELMEEILLKPFEEPSDGDDDPEPESRFGPDSGEHVRADFTAVDDYHGYAEQPGCLLDPAGNVINDSEAAGLSRHVTVSYVYVPGQELSEAPSFLRVVVEVQHNGAPVVTLTRLVHWIH